MIYHCFFEQSGTFKNEFKKLGFISYDYDIENLFNQTDYIIDLFSEIDNSYNGKTSIFDNFRSDNDFIFAFFPCTYFSVCNTINFLGNNKSMKKWSLSDKLEYDIKLMNNLNHFYNILCKLVIVCIRKNISLVIENPYTGNHFLKQYWCFKPTIIDLDRTKWGDYFKKPTQYWFLNFIPHNNILLEPIYINNSNSTFIKASGFDRNLISSEYANRFIRTYLI